MSNIVARHPLVSERLKAAGSLIAEVARTHGVDAFDLRLRLGLHLSILWARGEWENDSALRLEAARLAVQSYKLQAPHAQFAEPLTEGRLEHYRFCEMADNEVESKVRPILEAYHYLRSFREHSRHFGLTDSAGRPAAVLTLSPFDLTNFFRVWIDQGVVVRPEQLGVVSRIYVFRGAPSNAISYMLSNVRRWCASEQPEVDGLVTYVNPNLGLSGVSYRASSWRAIGLEAQWGSAYVDGNYATVRQVEQFTRRADPAERFQSLAGRLSVVKFPLKPLYLFGIGWRRLRKLNDLTATETEPWKGLEEWASF